MQNPKMFHLEAIIRILRYIRETLIFGLFYKSKVDCKLESYCDTDYANDYDIRGSTICYVLSLGSGAII